MQNKAERSSAGQNQAVVLETVTEAQAQFKLFVGISQADRAGLDKALRGENSEQKVSNTKHAWTLLYSLSLSLSLSVRARACVVYVYVYVCVCMCVCVFVAVTLSTALWRPH